MDTRFEWDDEKDRSNQLKHGVDFIEAASAFTDDDSLIMADPDSSGTEERYIVIGLSASNIRTTDNEKGIRLFQGCS